MDAKTFAYNKITLVHAIFTFAIVLIDPVFAIYLNQQGFEPIWIGVILSSFSLAMIFTAPLIGGISDNWGRRPLILVGISLAMIAFWLYVSYHNPIILFIARVLEAIAYSCVVFISIAKLEDLVTEQKKKISEKIGMSLSIGKAGFVVGPLFGGYVATSLGMVAPFYLGIVVLGLLWLLYFILPHRVHPRPPLEKLTFNPLPAIRDFLKIKPFKGLGILVSVHQFSIPITFIFVPLHVVSQFGMGIEQVGFALFVREIPQLFQFLAGKWTDSIGSKKIIVMGATVSGIGLIGAGLSQTFDWFLISMFLYGIGGTLLGISSLAFISGIAEKMRREGTFLGTLVSVSKIGAFAGFILAGIIAQLSSIPTLFIVGGTLLLLSIILAEDYLGSHSFPIPSPSRLIGAIFRHR